MHVLKPSARGVRDPLGTGQKVALDPAWVKQQAVTDDVPILGEHRWHRAMLPGLRDALGELVDRALAHLVDPGDYAGCFSPRRIGETLTLSRHAWGLEVMRGHGFDFSGDWPVPDAMHFEYRTSS